jgi:hypothetical protein
MYKIKDLNNEDIIGSFYEDELSHSVKPEEFKIDKILKKKVIKGIPMSFVSWKGYGKDFNQWIRDIDIVELKKS